MGGAAVELQRAIHSALTGDAELTAALGEAKIYDQPRANLSYPFITFGRSSIHDWSTASEEGAEILLTLHVWSKYRGRAEALTLAEHVVRVLHDGDLSMSAQKLVNLTLEENALRYDEDHDLYEASLHFRAVMEPF